MKVKMTYYIPVEKEIEMTPEEYCIFHADGALNGEKVIPNNAICEEINLTKEAKEELELFFFNKKVLKKC